jgi:hypothetical protein
VTDTTVTAGARVVPASGPTGRLALLLAVIRREGGEWTTKRVQDFYRRTPLPARNAPDGRLRHIARGDLRDLHTWGHLVLHETTGRRYYTLNTRKDRSK